MYDDYDDKPRTRRMGKRNIKAQVSYLNDFRESIEDDSENTSQNNITKWILKSVLMYNASFK